MSTLPERNDPVRLRLVTQKLEDVKDDAEARKRGFPKGGSFKLLQRDIVLVPEAQAQETFKANAEAAKKNAVRL